MPGIVLADTFLRDVYFQAATYPESIDSYVSSHKSKFNGEFFDCLNEQITKLADSIEDQKQRCDELWTIGSDFWHSFYNEITGKEEGTRPARDN